MNNYSCVNCKKYDDLNGYICRVCGDTVQFEHKSRTKIHLVRSTDEKHCDHCGENWHGGTSCKPKIDRKF